LPKQRPKSSIADTLHPCQISLPLTMKV